MSSCANRLIDGAMTKLRDRFKQLADSGTSSVVEAQTILSESLGTHNTDGDKTHCAYTPCLMILSSFIGQNRGVTSIFDGAVAGHGGVLELLGCMPAVAWKQSN